MARVVGTLMDAGKFTYPYDRSFSLRLPHRLRLSLTGSLQLAGFGLSLRSLDLLPLALRLLPGGGTQRNISHPPADPYIKHAHCIKGFRQVDLGSKFSIEAPSWLRPRGGQKVRRFGPMPQMVRPPYSRSSRRRVSQSCARATSAVVVTGVTPVFAAVSKAVIFQ